MGGEGEEEVEELAGGEVEREPGGVTVTAQAHVPAAAHHPPRIQRTHSLQVLTATHALS